MGKEEIILCKCGCGCKILIPIYSRNSKCLDCRYKKCKINFKLL